MSDYSSKTNQQIINYIQNLYQDIHGFVQQRQQYKLTLRTNRTERTQARQTKQQQLQQHRQLLQQQRQLQLQNQAAIIFQKNFRRILASRFVNQLRQHQ